MDVEESSEVRFFDDIYGHDVSLEETLAAGRIEWLQHPQKWRGQLVPTRISDPRTGLSGRENLRERQTAVET